jgi:hypothetical protein
MISRKDGGIAVFDIRTASLQDYDPNIFHRLDKFRLAKQSLSQHSAEIIELGDLICHFDMQDHVGISLLHKHYSIHEDEIVVRRFVEGVAYMSPVLIQDVDDVIPYVWKAEVANGHASYYPLEFCQYPDESREAALTEIALLVGAEGFLAELAHRLTQLNLASVFGLMTASCSKGLKVEPGETLLETTDEEARVLTLKPVPEADVEGLDSTQTFWMFSWPEGASRLSV